VVSYGKDILLQLMLYFLEVCLSYFFISKLQKKVVFSIMEGRMFQGLVSEV